MDDTPYNIGRLTGASTAERQDWSGIFSLLLRRPFLNRVLLQLGVEHLIFRDFTQDETAADLRGGDTTGDFDETSLAVQLSIDTPYLGYTLQTLMGIRVSRRYLERFEQPSARETGALSFVTVYGSIR